MGFSFRKSLSIGPMRVNLSSSGIGYSVGVKGARLGVNKRGTYVSLGAGGIQYRKYIQNNTTNNPYSPPAPLPATAHGQLHTITSDEISQLSDSDSQDFINELTEKASKISFAKWGSLLLVLLLSTCLFGYFGQVTRTKETIVPKVEIIAPSGLKIRQQPDPEALVIGSAVYGSILPLTDSTMKHWYGVSTGGYVSKKFARITFIPETKQFLRIDDHPQWFWTGFTFCLAALLGAYIYLARIDKKRLTLEINYEFNDDLAQVHTGFLKAFEQISTSHKVWQYLHSEQIDDRRRNAGASSAITRIALNGVALNRKPTRHLVTNVPIPYLGLRNTELYFFPERLVIRRNNQFAAVFYKNLHLTSRDSSFIEEGSVPSDATIIGHTWRYVNKSGSADRRFSNNRQIPKCAYSEYAFRSGTGVYEVVTTSRRGVLDLFTQYIARIGEVQQRMCIN
ncbi:DUF4236 domain-containing protein [Hymenobacter sp. HDW8]|uniref:DUF4236 domain-containing protein n=1 Tax=Hymenobacter sp. HDW8 TaxID=2714932 RepID=UPI00140BCECF|nr:DUF4236 domain-containing protein [Hymenobacter sp. HDW8]QIL78380.1 DUF4236 domain-containing protein [Hymenobacter sp. HDW8]